jgi:hypothetical protein
MGQFKPMVKMMTTEPSVILKLKKGGKVEHKMDGGYMPMQSTMPAQAMPAGLPARGGSAPAASPMKPSMAARRKAMMAKPTKPMNASLLMKKGGKADMHEDAAQDRAMIKKALAGKKFATGGVVNGQAGYKDGGKVYSKGIIPESVSAKGAEAFKNTKMHTAKPDRSPAKTGDVKLGNGGGYAMGGTIKGATDWENRPANTAKAGKTGGTTGGVRKGNAGGYKEGGATKKAYATGGTVDTGKPVAMPQKPVSRPVANSMQSGTFAKGGKVEKAEKPNLRLVKTYTGPKGHVAKVYKDRDWQEYRTKFYTPEGKYLTEGDSHTDDAEDAHSTAKNQVNNARYKQGGTAKRYNAGGTTVDASKGAYDKSIGPSEEEMDMAKAIRNIPSKLFQGAKSMMGLGSSAPKPPAGSVTKTEKSVTVTPANKKRGGRC